MIRHGMKVLVAALLTTAAAHAETPVPLSRITWSPKPAIDITDSRLSLAAPYASRVAAPDPSGLRRTAIDHRFAAKDVVGSVGYLCGLQPGPNEGGGPASAFEPEGTFLGGKLTMALR